jgi:hypothetical protein
MTALLQADHHLVRTGQVLLGDNGFAGRDFQAFITNQLGTHLVRPDRRNEPARFGNLARVRQWVAAVFDTLKASSTWKPTADAPSPAYSSASPNAYWP